jgi:o-succinylbenzoate synthase
LRINYTKYTLNFGFPAGTSRGVLHHHTIYVIQLWHKTAPEIVGIGEAAPLPGLSLDYVPNFENQLASFCEQVNKAQITEAEALLSLLPKNLPSLYFAIETALADLVHLGKRQLFDTPFYKGQLGIPINGLIWMGDKPTMAKRIYQKLDEGYKILKLKIGGISFAEELELLAEIRANFSAEDLEIRLDANGAFSPNTALAKLEQLAKYHIHSLEQPIAAGQVSAMKDIVNQSMIPIALDEEMIGLQDPTQKETLLAEINPHYIILKPTLLGGFQATEQWINLAQKQNIAWWVTSALESSIGLNAIAQFTSQYPLERPHGLGTGQIYTNNIASPLMVENAHLHYQQNVGWDLAMLH